MCTTEELWSGVEERIMDMRGIPCLWAVLTRALLEIDILLQGVYG